MKSEILINHIYLDRPDILLEALEKDFFKFIVARFDEGDDVITIIIENRDLKNECSIMFDITKNEAAYIGKSLIALSDSF